MKKIISAKLAGNILLFSFGALVLFHVLVLLKIVPADIVWGGQIGDSATNLLTLEVIALIVTCVFIVIIAVKMDYLKVKKFKQAANIGMWFVFAYLLLNTIGNLASGVSFENIIFAPITIVLALCAFRLSIEK